jgi:hypothetical protein
VRSLASSLSTRPPMACGGSTVRLFDCSTVRRGPPLACIGVAAVHHALCLFQHCVCIRWSRWPWPRSSNLAGWQRSEGPRLQPPGNKRPAATLTLGAGRWALDRSLMVAGSFAANRLLATGSGTPKLPPKFPATCRAASSRECMLATTPLLASLR